MNKNLKSFDPPPWQLHSQCLIDRVQFIYNQEIHPDVEFEIRTNIPQLPEPELRRYKAHSLILASASPIFEKLFFGEGSSNGSGTIPITHCSQFAFKKMLDYIYTNDCNFGSPLKAMETNYPAHYFQIKHLENKCLEFLRITTFPPEDVIPIFEDNLLSAHTDLQNKCLEIVRRKPLEMIKRAAECATVNTITAFLNLESMVLPSEFFLFKELVEGIRSRTSMGNFTKRTFLQQFRPQIRFLSMTTAEFEYVLRMCNDFNGNIMTDLESLQILRKLCSFRHIDLQHDLPDWCNRITTGREISPSRCFHLISNLNRFIPVIQRPHPFDFINSLKINVEKGKVIFTGLWLHYNRISRNNNLLIIYTIKIMNNNGILAFEDRQTLTVNNPSVGEKIMFKIPLSICENETYTVLIILNQFQDFQFCELTTNIVRSNPNIDECKFNIILDNFGVGPFAISELYYAVMG